MFDSIQETSAFVVDYLFAYTHVLKSQFNDCLYTKYTNSSSSQFVVSVGAMCDVWPVYDAFSCLEKCIVSARITYITSYNRYPTLWMMAQCIYFTHTTQVSSKLFRLNEMYVCTYKKRTTTIMMMMMMNVTLFLIHYSCE